MNEFTAISTLPQVSIPSKNSFLLLLITKDIYEALLCNDEAVKEEWRRRRRRRWRSSSVEPILFAIKGELLNGSQKSFNSGI